MAHTVHVAGIDEIAAASCSLSVSAYVEAEDTREKISITKLNSEIDTIVAQENVLREEIRKIIEEIKK